MFSEVLYQLGIFSYNIFIRFAQLMGNEKAKQFIQGRTNWESILKEKSTALTAPQRIWIHCASLGEFEQGRAIIELLKKDANIDIVLSFFSPSGYEIRKNYANADLITYLPIDNAQNAQKFLEIIKPDMAVFVKYEFWYYYLSELKAKGIPSILVAAVFEPKQIFFRSYGKLHRKMLHYFQQIFVQNELSKELLNKINISAIKCGDPRIDRVVEIPAAAQKFQNIVAFANHQPLIIAGSVWPEDITLLANTLKLLPENYKLLLVPHEINDHHLKNITESFPNQKVALWDDETDKLMLAKIAIVNTVGILSSLYQYADLVWIGGGFNKSGIHNTLEPASFGKPIAFGSNYQKFPEAVYFVENANGLSTDNSVILSKWIIEMIENVKLRDDTSKKIIDYLEENKGASATICNYLTSLFPSIV